jgi:hypothetical protein
MGLNGQLHTPAALLLGIQPQHPLYSRLDGPQSLSGHHGEEKNLLPLSGIKPQLIGCPACSLVAILAAVGS